MKRHWQLLMKPKRFSKNALEQLEKVAISEESSQGVKTGDAANFAGISALMVQLRVWFYG